ncbi:MAG: nitrogenase component 1 [Paludibacteraceae bacterium]|nr:nitrogenase component 1 [Paludibacteraceae bacterium]
MTKILDEPRYVCALGALQTVEAIYKAIPVVHAGPGCTAKVSIGGRSGYLGTQTVPCTNVGETEVVFGGEEKLHDVIENSLKVMDGDIFIVLSGCTTEIVGDDIDNVVGTFKDSEKPVLSVPTAGFKGTNIEGHEWVVDAIIDQYLSKRYFGEKIKGLVNIWGPVPSYDPHWVGNFRELENLIRELGLTPNCIFGEYRGIDNINLVPRAKYNLLVAPWVGLGNVKNLKEKFGTPYLHYPTLPIGAHETSLFLRTVGKEFNVDSNLVEELITRKEKEYYYYIERSCSFFFENRASSKMFSTVASADYALSLSRFFVNDMGLVPSKQYITEGVPEEHYDRIRQYFKEFNYEIEAEVVFSNDGYQIHQQIENDDYAGTPLILGSIYEKKLASKLNGTFLCVSTPYAERVVIHSSYVGYHGGLKLLEDLYTSVFQKFN